jgi:hypothetical protein
MIFEDFEYPVAAETVQVIWLPEIMYESSCCRIQPVQSLFGPYPDLPETVLKKSVYEIIAETGGIAFVRLIQGDVAAVIFVETGLRTEPNQPPPVLENAIDGALRKAVLNGEMLKPYVGLRKHARREVQEQEQERNEIWQSMLRPNTRSLHAIRMHNSHARSL